ncbi:MAG: class I SAM-dependent methyltransferase [Nanoarchaeota archaeon]
MGKWYNAFKKNMNTVFTEEDFNDYKELIKHDLQFYRKYLKKEDKILDIGCGLGVFSVPLSTFGYKIIGIDNDKKVLEAAIENGKNFGKEIEFKLADIFNIDKEFDKNSFDVCISGGVLEHFSKDEIRDIIDKQLVLAPIVIASFPIRTKRTLKHYDVKDIREKEVCCDKIHRNLWTEYQWRENILEFYEIEDVFVNKCHSLIGRFDEMLVVIKRDYKGEEFEGLVDKSDEEIRIAELFTGSYGWSEKLAAFELYLMNAFDFPFKAKFRSSEYGDKDTVFNVVRITCCRDKGGVFCEIRYNNGKREEIPVYFMTPVDKKHKGNIALKDYIKWLPFKV